MIMGKAKACKCEQRRIMDHGSWMEMDLLRRRFGFDKCFGYASKDKAHFSYRTVTFCFPNSNPTKRAIA